MSYSSGLLYWMRTLYHKLLASLYSLIFEVIKSGKLKSVMRSVAFVVHVQAFSIQYRIFVLRSWVIVTFSVFVLQIP